MPWAQPAAEERSRREARRSELKPLTGTVNSVDDDDDDDDDKLLLPLSASV